MRPVLFALILVPTLALAVDDRTGSQALVQGVGGFMDHAASPARVTTSTSSARTATDVAEYSYVRIYCSVDTAVKFGGSTVTADFTADPTLVGGLPEVFNMGNNTRIAFDAGGAGYCDVTVLK